MIVDDELFAREGMVHDINWNSLDFTVCAVAKDGLQALEKYQETLPDLIISDINMPLCNGIEMLQQLRNQGSDVQIIFLTAYSEFDYARDALRLYAADYILKPFEDGTIETSVQKLIPKLTKEKIHKRLMIRTVMSKKQLNTSNKIMQTLIYPSMR